MSIICAAIKNGVVAISGDSQTNYGALQVSAKHIRSSRKIYPINGSVMGIVGWSAMSLLVQHLMIHEKKMFQLGSRMEIYATLLKLHEKMKDDYYIDTREDDGDQPVESSQVDTMIVNKYGIFQTSSYRSVNEFQTYWAIGSGKRLALGAMHAMFGTKTTAKSIVESGVKAAAEFDDSCGLPLNTRTIKLAK
jgi:ATP-dependent HslUV protease, peptidase subunit HslV